jgi:hypothetical protein
MALTLYLLLAPAVPGPSWLDFLPYADKWVHAGIFGLFAGLLAWALDGRKLAWAFLAVLAWGAATELLQGLLTDTRQPDVLDWLADAAGGLLALMAWRWRR